MLGIILSLLFFCFTSSGTQHKYPNSHATHLLDEFIVNVCTEWIDLIGNPISACRLISGNNIVLMECV